MSRRSFAWRRLVPRSLGAAALVLVSLTSIPSTAPLAAQASDPLVSAYAKMDPTNRFTVQAIIDSARAIGLPDTPLRSRVLQGVQKKASSGQIAASVRQKFGWLRTARTALGPVTDNELDAASAVLEAGGKPAQLASFKARQKGREAVEAFTDLADLISRGVPGEEASSAIAKLWQEGADDATFHSLWNNVQTDISQGLNPGTALQNRIRETPAARTATPQSKPPEGQQENQRSE